jgi:hypothetical protein
LRSCRSLVGSRFKSRFQRSYETRFAKYENICNRKSEFYEKLSWIYYR